MRPPLTRLERLASALAALLVATAASARPLPPDRPLGWPSAGIAVQWLPADVPHPAVVRVVASNRGSLSYGSGTLVAVNARYGLVVTNWHVVCEATGPIVVVFPDGFRSGATVAKTDRDWDLAALVIWRPRAAPVALAGQAPRPGEPLAIAGYGADAYRAVAGRCTQYVSPGRNFPFEMVELSAGARQGDSGGPIFNSRGELAGVLFGTAHGLTTGAYCGRVRWFLAPLASDFPDLVPGQPMLAQRVSEPEPSKAEPVGTRTDPMPIVAIAAAPADPVAPQAETPSSGTVATGWRSVPAAAATHPTRPSPTIATTVSADSSGGDLFGQVKDILAAIGAVAVVLAALRTLSSLHGA